MCALANIINAKVKKGFYLNSLGKMLPFDSDAYYLWKRGIDDDFMKKDNKNYSQLIIEASGFEYSGKEKYVMPSFDKHQLLDSENNIIGLNTGAGSMWKTRIWPKDKWSSLIKKLQKQDFEVILLGGPDEHLKNQELSDTTGAHYFGVKPFTEFINIVDNCDVVVTAVTFALHVAVGLDKRVVLFNNIFNKHEFDLPNVSVIEPKVSCTMCYKSKFDNGCQVKDCMDIIHPDQVLGRIQEVSSCP
jgi:heptosyltransferase-2